MSFTLDSVDIKNPNEITESNSTQVAQIRTLSGSIARDYFGSNKRVWELNYKNAQKADYDAIKTIYDSYLATNTAKTWKSTEANYPITQTTVHVDLQSRGFSVLGTDYLTDFTLILTEV